MLPLIKMIINLFTIIKHKDTRIVINAQKIFDSPTWIYGRFEFGELIALAAWLRLEWKRLHHILWDHNVFMAPFSNGTALISVSRLFSFDALGYWPKDAHTKNEQTHTNQRNVTRSFHWRHIQIVRYQFTFFPFFYWIIW